MPPVLRIRGGQRRGVILLVVTLFLTLFAVVALTFVLYAESEAVASRLRKEAESPRGSDAEPELLLSHFLQQFIYDVPDARRGVGSVNSALRGHSLVRTLTGYNTTPGARNDQFYNGVGRIRSRQIPFAGRVNSEPLDEYHLINYMQFPGDPVHDPERPGWRSPDHPPLPYAGGFNAPYTYPDLNSMFLAAQRPIDGAVLMPSFHRPWLFGSLQRDNPNWRNHYGRYLLLRPRPEDNARDPATGQPLFPYPEDEGGDVKNLVGAPGYFDGKHFYNNDSVWLDIGYPIQVGPDGRRFKPLFAPLVLDLDNRLNLNVVGNIRGSGYAHRSNQGWGPWEINPRQLVLNGSAVQQDEWANLFLAAATRPTSFGRYGTADNTTPEGLPGRGLGRVTAVPPLPRFFSQVDFDAADDSGGMSGTLTVPTGSNPFPTFGTGYGNYSTAELTAHPMLYDVYAPDGNDRDLGSKSNLEALLRYGDTNAPAFTSNLYQFLPRNLSDPRIRRLVTTCSYDIDQPGSLPWVWDRTMAPLRLAGSADYPTGGPMPFPTARPGTPPPQHYPTYPSEFGSDWKAAFGRHSSARQRLGGAGWDFGRLDLNRSLPDYPTNPNGDVTESGAGYQAAVSARQSFARDIFQRLCYFTNAGPCLDDQGNPLPTMPAVTSPEYAALRWLAQLAVNIVDYLDPDDQVTAFNWNAHYGEAQLRAITRARGLSTAAKQQQREDCLRNGWVFGTELPRVVIQRAAAKRSGSTIDVAVRLYDPFQNDPARPDDGSATLQGAYRVLVCRPSAMQTLTQAANVRGQPLDADRFPRSGGGSGSAVGDTFTSRPRMAASGGDPAQGYWLSSRAQFPDGWPGAADQVDGKLACDGSAGEATAVLCLQRTVCHGLPPNDPGDSTYDPNRALNPYVTVDYMADVDLNGGTRERRHPYVADTEAGAVPDQAWLVHLDRNVASVTEVLQVYGYKPHELTHRFKGGSSTAHLAPWFDEQARIYRALEFFTTHRGANGLMASTESPKAIGTTNTREAIPLGGGVYEVGVAARAGITESGTPWAIRPGTRLRVGGELVEAESTPTSTSFVASFVSRPEYGTPVRVLTLGDRIAGRVNINTLFPDAYDKGQPVSTVFRALCDAQPGGSNHFGRREVDEAYRRLLRSRTPGATPGPGDRPFLPFTVGVSSGDHQYPGGSGMESTIFRTVDGQRLFEFTPTERADHPCVRQSLLNKIYGSLTLRSNVFAVWVTAGFFAVDAQGRLGPEIGRTEGRHVRHRMFAIVDRSVFAKTPGATSATLSNLVKPVFPPFGGGEVQVFPASMADIHQGSQVTISNRGATDNVGILGTAPPNQIVAGGFQQNYDPGATLTFTANVPQMQNGSPVLDPDTGLPSFSPQTITTTVASPIVGGQGTLTLSDPSVLPYLRPGMQATVSNASYAETTTVTRVSPTDGPPNSFFCTLRRIYNVGDQTSVGYFAPTADVIDPCSVGPQRIWNTRDDHGFNDPVVFYSVID